jgi:hypothetical protein
MAFKISTGLRNHLLVTGSLKDALDGGVIRIYSGTEPATADAALAGNTLLCTISNNGAGTGITLDGTPSSGVVSKATGETWKGTNAASGLASFYRFSGLADAGTLSTSEVRAQGSIAAVGAELNLANPTLTSGAEQRVDTYVIGMPAV